MPARALSPLETPYAVTNTTSSGSFVVRGPLDADRLARAYAALRREYPVLAGRFVVTDHGLEITTGDGAPSAEREAGAPITVAHGAFAPGDAALGLQPETGVSAVRLDSDADIHRVTLGVNHAIADGAHALLMNLRLWQLYTDPTAEQPVVTALPDSPTDLAAASGVVSLAAHAPNHPDTRAVSAATSPTVDSLDSGRFAFERIRLDAAATTALRARAKALGLSLHGLLVGVIVLAERVEIDRPAEDPVSMAVFSPVDLRARVDPPVPAASVTNFAGSSIAPLQVRADSTVDEIGRAVLDRLRSDLADGTVASALAGTPGVRVRGGAPIRLSNIGPVPMPSLPVELTAIDFYTSSEVDIDRIRVLARTAPPEALEALIGLHYHALTFDGRLSIEIRHAPGTMTPDATGRIRDRIRDALSQAVGAAA